MSSERPSGSYRGHDDATERDGADKQILAWWQQRPEQVQRALQRDEPAARHLATRLAQLLGLTKGE
jgi:hypothetical protein